ncbi:hypothetical protein RFI_35163, partial [Reticulomyxa filosa]
MCSNVPTIVVTSIKSKELKSAIAVIKFIGLKNKNILPRKVLVHTVSGNFRTLFVHFAVDVNEQQLNQLDHNFNENSKTFAAEQKQKRENAVINPEINKYVLLRGVSIHESENEIKETLEDYGYQVQEVKRFNKMPIIKVMLSNFSDV